MISYTEALNTILSRFSPLGLERVGILDALGRVMGEDVIAARPIPPHDNSAMDGYALRWEDTLGASKEKPAVLTVIEDIPAGAVPSKTVGRGEAARIMTGAPIPAGADAVLRMEDTEKEGQRVRILVPVQGGQDIRFAGEDVLAGERVIARGDLVRPPEVGMLAALGRPVVSVHQRPLVAIVATGDELSDLGDPPSPWKIISSNSYSLAAQVLDCGAIPIQIGIAKDRREDLLEKFQAAARADVIVSSGGVSVGDYDLVKDILAEVGNEMQFWRVAMRPGRPLAFGAISGVPAFGLPGNPVSSMISFEQFVRPALLKMMGRQNWFRKTLRAVIKEDLEKKTGLRYFIRARLRWEGGAYTVTSTGEQGSGILKSMVLANSLIVLPEEVSQIRAGDTVNVQMLDETLLQTASPEL